MQRLRSWGFAVAAIGALAGMGSFLVVRARHDDREAAATDRPVTEWVKALADPSPEVRRQAAVALANLGPRAAGALLPLLHALEDDVLLVRVHATIALSKLGQIGFRPLMDGLRSPNAFVRRGASGALALQMPGAAEAAPLLAAALDDADEGVRVHAASGLTALGPAATEFLLQAVRVAGPAGRTTAIEAIGRLRLAPAATVGPLAAALADPDPTVTRAAGFALACFGSAGLPALIAALDAPEVSVRRAAAAALADMGDDARLALGMIIGRLADVDTAVRRSAAEALGRIGPDAAGAVAALRESLKDADAPVRRSAAYALGRIGREAQAAVPTLMELQADAADAVREAATRALVDIVLSVESYHG